MLELILELIFQAGIIILLMGSAMNLVVYYGSQQELKEIRAEIHEDRKSILKKHASSFYNRVAA